MLGENFNLLSGVLNFFCKNFVEWRVECVDAVEAFEVVEVIEAVEGADEGDDEGDEGDEEDEEAESWIRRTTRISYLRIEVTPYFTVISGCGTL